MSPAAWETVNNIGSLVFIAFIWWLAITPRRKDQ